MMLAKCIRYSLSAACSGGGCECELKQSKGDTINIIEVRLYIMSLADSLGERMHEHTALGIV